MTEIAFHVNVPDKLDYSCRLLRKVYRSGVTVTVTGEAEVLDELNRLLWTFSPADFLPHCFADAPAGSIAVTPILLTESLANSSQRKVLVNLGQAVPAGFEGFERLVEVVAQGSGDVAAGRSRWKHYAARGYALTSHEPGGAGGSR